MKHLLRGGRPFLQLLRRSIEDLVVSIYFLVSPRGRYVVSPSNIRLLSILVRVLVLVCSLLHLTPRPPLLPNSPVLSALTMCRSLNFAIKLFFGSFPVSAS